MNRDEYLIMLENEPLTPGQRGAIMRECGRLGLDGRAERLDVLADLLGLDELGSTADLTMGQGGYLVNLLQRTRDRSELLDATAAADDGEGQLDGPADDDGQDHNDTDAAGDGEFISVTEAISRIMLMIAPAVYGRDFPAADSIAANIRRLRVTGRFQAQGLANCEAEWAAPRTDARKEDVPDADPS